MYVDPIQRGWLQSNIHFNWIRLISTLMNSWIPLPFPYFRSQRGLNLSAGICAGVSDDDQTHLKENNTLTPKHLMPAWGWMSFQSSSSAFGVASLFLFLFFFFFYTEWKRKLIIPKLDVWLCTTAPSTTGSGRNPKCLLTERLLRNLLSWHRQRWGWLLRWTFLWRTWCTWTL